MGWITLIGDLHGRAPDVRPDSYLVLLAGDICRDADQAGFLDGPFREWLGRLPCPVVAVGGNHDRILDQDRSWKTRLPWHLLNAGESIDIAGITIWGCPLVLDTGMAFHGREEDFEQALAGMPDRCDVLLLHNPPMCVLDRPSGCHTGSLAVRHAIWKKQPKLCVFGHVHEGRGWKQVDHTYCVNATLGAGCAGTGYPVPHPHPPWGLSDSSWKDR